VFAYSTKRQACPRPSTCPGLHDRAATIWDAGQLRGIGVCTVAGGWLSEMEYEIVSAVNVELR
jgi:hypothetical protein